MGDRSGEPRSSPGFSDYLHSVRTNWWLIVLVALLCAGVTGLLASRTDTEYRTGASLVLAPAPDLEDSDQQLGALASMKDQLTTTLARFVTSGAVLEEAGDGAFVEELDREELEVTAHVIPDSLVVEIDVTGEGAELVGAFISAVVDAIVDGFEELYEVSIVEQLDPSPLVEPSSPSVGRRVAIAGVAGLGVGFLLGLLRDASSRARWRKRNGP